MLTNVGSIKLKVFFTYIDFVAHKLRCCHTNRENNNIASCMHGSQLAGTG